MYLSYANFTINKPERKQKNVVNLAEVYRQTASLMFPVKHDGLTLMNLQACSNNKGCNPKKQNGTVADYMIAMKTEDDEIQKNTIYLDDEKYVVLFAKCTFKLGQTEANLNLRIQKSGIIGARIGLSTQTKITMSSNDDALNKLERKLTDCIFSMFPMIPKLGDTHISAVSVQGYNVFNPKTGLRPNKRIKNFVSTLRMIDSNLPSHDLDYNQRDGKQIARGNFKPNDSPFITIGVTTWGMVDFLGNGKISDFKETASKLQIAFASVKHKITLNDLSKPPVPTKKSSGPVQRACPKGLPAVNKNGNCPDGRIPVPNKHKSICCYKMKLSQTTASEISSKYHDANIVIPAKLSRQLNKFSSIKTNFNAVPVLRNNNVFFKGKPFRCAYMSKHEIQRIAIAMNINPIGFKNDLCKRILSKIKQ